MPISLLWNLNTHQIPKESKEKALPISTSGIWCLREDVLSPKEKLLVLPQKFKISPKNCSLKEEKISYHGSALCQRRAQLSDEKALKGWASPTSALSSEPSGHMEG